MERDVIFEWDKIKDEFNQDKHGISFKKAKEAFNDPHRLIYKDIDHSTKTEKRYYCLGKISGRVATVRFIYREGKVRIFGAGYWRKERKIYEKANKKL